MPSSTTHISLVLWILPVVSPSFVPAVGVVGFIVLLTTVRVVSLRRVGRSVAVAAAAEAVAFVVVVCLVEFVWPVAANSGVVMEATGHR